MSGHYCEVPLEGAETVASIRHQKSPRVVILEDEWLVRRDLEMACSRLGIEVVCSTADPDEFGSASARCDVGFALIDLKLGDDPVAGEIAALKLRERHPDIRVVLVTGDSHAVGISHLLMNCSALLKPYTSIELEAVLVDLIRRGGNG